MRQRLTYCRRDVRAPDELVRAVHLRPTLPTVAEWFARDPDLVWADHLFLAACRVPGREGHGGSIDEADKHQDERCAIVRLFVEHGADPSMRNKRKVSPLHMSCRFDLPRVATQLLELGAEIDAYDEARETPLCRAVNLGYVDCACALLAHAPDLSFTDRKGHTPLHRAVMRGKKKIVRLLLAAGADRDALDKDGKRPVDHSRNREITRALEA